MVEMADIHVLTGSMWRSGTRKVLKSYVFHFSIPVEDQVAEAALDPELVAFESAVPDIEQAELDAICAGGVVEKAVQIPYNRTATNAEVATKVQTRYAEMANFVRLEYIEKYRQYLVTLAV